MMQTNELFRKNIQFVQYGRSGSVLTTLSHKTADELHNQGWTLHKVNNTFRLNPPSINLVDISDISKINQYFNPLFNFVLYKFFKKKLEKNSLNNFIDTVINEHRLLFKNFDYHVSFGPILNFAIKIEGSDDRIFKMQQLIVEAVLNDEQFQIMQKEITLKYSQGFLSNKSKLIKENVETYNNLCAEYKQKKSLNDGDLIYTVDTNALNFDNYDYVLLILSLL